MANIFSTIWNTIKSIPEQFKAAYQIGTQGMANIAKSKLTAALGIQQQPKLNIPVGQNLTPQATQQAYQALFPSAATSSPTSFIQFVPKTTPNQSYYQPAVTSVTSVTSRGTTIPISSTPSYTPPPPPQGAQGTSYQLSHQSYQGGGVTYTPYIPPTGASGTAAHTGLLGGVISEIGGGSISPTDTESTDKEKKNITVKQGAYTIKGGDTLSQIAAQYGTTVAALMAANPSITNPNLIYAGSRLNIPTTQQGQPITPPPALNLPSFVNEKGELNLDIMQSGLTKIADLLKSPLIQQSKAEMMNYLETAKNTLLEVSKQLNPLPPEPILKPEAVAEDQEGLDKLYQIEKRIYEDTQRELGIPQTITEYENALKELQATTQAFDAIIKEVNDDPDFPKGLARRRIQEIEKEKGLQIATLQNKIQLLQTSLELKRQEFANRMGITQRAISRQATQQTQARQTARDELKTLIDTKGIITMSDKELSDLAKATGYTYEGLKQIQAAVKKGDTTTLFTTADGQVLDVATVNGVKNLMKAGYNNYAELYAWYAAHTKLPSTAINNLLKQAGVIPADVTITTQTFRTPSPAEFQGFVNWFNKFTEPLTQENWQTIKNSWIANGFDPTKFDTYFKDYKPTSKTDVDILWERL